MAKYIKCYASPEEQEIIKAYASEDTRTVSEFLFAAARGTINRSKKKGADGKIITMPVRSR